MASIRQIAANRLNAQLSTGPRTAGGKERSRGNALTHGLAGAGEVMVDDDQREVDSQEEAFRDIYRPRDVEEEFLVREVAVNTVRVLRCQRQEQHLLAVSRLRAATSWDDDRRLDAEETLTGRGRRPGLTMARLRLTKQGAEAVRDLWQHLALTLEAKGELNDDQVSLAHDLVGTPIETRDVTPWGDLAPAQFVAEEIRRLDDLIENRLDSSDARERAMAEQGLDVGLPTKPLRTLRRYEAACLRRVRLAQEELERRRGPAEPSNEVESVSRSPGKTRPGESDDAESDSDQESVVMSFPPPPAAPAGPKCPMNRRRRRAEQKAARARRTRG